jgi:hypothetical protein
MMMRRCLTVVLATLILAVSTSGKDEKSLAIYGCTNSWSAEGVLNSFSACKLYEPETGNRYLVVISGNGRPVVMEIKAK